MERHGYRTTVGERLREEYQKRVDARLAKSAENQPQPARSIDEMRREARERWLRMREGAERHTPETKSARVLDDDRSL
jgi:hypothetical protein